MRYESYEGLQDTNVVWLGRVPRSWSVSRVKDHSRVISGYPFDSKLFDPEVGTPLIRIRDIASSSTEVRVLGTVPDQATVDNGDILIGMDGDFNVAWWRAGPAALNQRVACLRAESGSLQRFLYYAVPFHLKIVNELTYFTTVKHLSNTDILRTRFALPPDDEVTQIAKFLDYETARIDALIEKQQQLIALLQEKRQAVISHAVTKGLNPDAPMRDSGVEWLGKVPAHWTIKRFKHACSEIFLGLTTRVDYVEDGGVPLVRAGDFTTGKLLFDNVRCISKAQHEFLTKYRRAMRGDVLLSKSGSIGTVALVDTDREFSIYESVFVLRGRPGLLGSAYLMHLMDADSTRAQYSRNRVGMGVSHLNMGDFVDVKVPIPPLADQLEIAAFIDAQLQQFSELTSLAEKQAALLTERRTALISAAVTGKIDVRNWTPPSTDVIAEVA